MPSSLAKARYMEGKPKHKEDKPTVVTPQPIFKRRPCHAGIADLCSFDMIEVHRIEVYMKNVSHQFKHGRVELY